MATVSVQHHQMFIDGKDVDSSDVFEIRSPATEQIVCTMAKGTVEHADLAVDAARRAFDRGEWARMPKDERSQVMKRIADRLGADMEQFIEAEIGPNGATVRQATGFHVGLAAPHFLHFAEQAATFEFEQDVPTAAYPTISMNRIRREPLGVCAAIVPWNFPLVLGIWKIGPALAAGNSVVVKVDEKTPLSLLRLAQVAHEEGVPAGVLNVVTGDGAEVGARLASHPGVDKVAFTGSTAVGREIMRLASGTVKKCSLELGGKAPVILLDDADLDIAVDGALFGCMLYSGQICESGTRLLVPEDQHDEVVERLVERASTIKLGDPNDYDTDMGPVISGRQKERILGYFEQARADGATFALGGGVPEGPEFAEGHWIEPTIITGVTNEMQIAREEIFGPALVVLTYKTVEEALEIANDSDYGLTAGIWSGDYERALEIAAQMRAGTVWINNWHQVDPALPFGGYKQSGVGRELGPDALNEYTEVKHVHVDLTQDKDGHIFDILLSTPAK
ncbi:MAG: aldehyde dehydrogenase [Thermoleophilaceae bacterium]|nr:aldehyde dehydrogenase [Thermoleophilaceae bacterium]